MARRDLLIEIGTEELPPKALPALAKSFQENVRAGMEKARLAFEDIHLFATPRRLALKLDDLEEQQAAAEVERLGPALQAAFDKDGNPTKAAEGFARSCGVDISALGRKEDGKVTKLYYKATRGGEPAAGLIPGIVTAALAELPIPKRMRWGASRVEFVRPVHWAVLLFGEDIIDAEILGLKTGNTTRGHRFHHPGEIPLAKPADYEAALKSQGRVIPNFAERREIIRAQVEAEAEKVQGRVTIDAALLDEVTALVEWPVALTGEFDRAFLDVPQEALISSMKEHQKCFYLLDANGSILPHFITISNIESLDPAQVVAGNEKVIRPRLADAAFFYAQDQKQSLASRREKLKTVVFQQDLGTLHDKAERVANLAAFIAGILQADATMARRAADLAKCDLLTGMVTEFAELQGIMGYYYARHDGEEDEVAQAINEQYLPRFAGDALPASQTGVVLALAERLDTIVGLFGIGQPPTGSKDPFALRRAALGILRICVEKQLDLDLSACVSQAIKGYDRLPKAGRLQETVIDFVFERFKAWYADTGVGTRIFLSVDAVRSANPLDFDRRIKAVAAFSTLREAEALSLANKRVSNILAKLESPPSATVDATLLAEAAEISLANNLSALLDKVTPLLAKRQYSDALAAMAALQADVDRFFDEVMVNTDDDRVRENRQALLQQLRQLFLQIADISHLQAA